MRRLLLASRIAALALAGCSNDVATEGEPATLAGTVTLRSGSCQPVSPPCKVSPLASVHVWVYPRITAEGSNWSHPDTSDLELVAETVSKSDGTYEVDVPAGDYSVLVEDAGEPVAVTSAGDALDPVHVVAAQTTTYDVQINHAVE